MSVSACDRLEHQSNCSPRYLVYRALMSSADLDEMKLVLMHMDIYLVIFYLLVI